MVHRPYHSRLVHRMCVYWSLPHCDNLVLWILNPQISALSMCAPPCDSWCYWTCREWELRLGTHNRWRWYSGGERGHLWQVRPHPPGLSRWDWNTRCTWDWTGGTHSHTRHWQSVWLYMVLILYITNHPLSPLSPTYSTTTLLQSSTMVICVLVIRYMCVLLYRGKL